MRSPSPTQRKQFDDFGPIGEFVPALHAQRQRDVLIGRQMVEQAKILEDDADAAAQIGDRILAEARGVAVEQADEAARRLQRQQDETQQGRLAGARRAGEELKRLRPDLETDVLQDFSSHSVSQTDIFKSDQARPRFRHARITHLTAL